MGWPVSHSRSPRLHGFWLREYGIDGAYVPLPVRPEDLPEALQALPKLGFRGVNVTVPHKVAAAKLMTRLTPFADRVGAVNTIIVADDGALEGHNSDGFGFIKNLCQHSPQISFKAGPAVVLGAGGAAAAIVAALLDAGVPEVRLVNRTRATAETLAMKLGGNIRCLDWADQNILTDAAFLVNATSLGMQGQPPLALELAGLPPQALVTDIVYSPLQTALLQQAAARGNPTVDGMGMLLHQARPGFAAWFGVEPLVTAALRDFVLA